MMRGPECPTSSIGSGCLIQDVESLQHVRVKNFNQKSKRNAAGDCIRSISTSVQCYCIDYQNVSKLHFMQARTFDDENNNMGEEGDEEEEHLGTRIGSSVTLPLSITAVISVDGSTSRLLSDAAAAFDALLEKHWDCSIRLAGVIIVIHASSMEESDEIESHVEKIFWEKWEELVESCKQRVQLMDEEDTRREKLSRRWKRNNYVSVQKSSAIFCAKNNCQNLSVVFNYRKQAKKCQRCTTPTGSVILWCYG